MRRPASSVTHTRATFPLLGKANVAALFAQTRRGWRLDSPRINVLLDPDGEHRYMRKWGSFLLWIWVVTRIFRPEVFFDLGLFILQNKLLNYWINLILKGLNINLVIFLFLFVNSYKPYIPLFNYIIILPVLQAFRTLCTSQNVINLPLKRNITIIEYVDMVLGREIQGYKVRDWCLWGAGDSGASAYSVETAKRRLFPRFYCLLNWNLLNTCYFTSLSLLHLK